MNKADLAAQRIRDELNARGHMTVAEAMALLGVSESTARRLFRRMHEARQAIRTYGGVERLPAAALDYSFAQGESRAQDEKLRIGQHGARLVADGDLVYLDSGTTLARFSDCLAERFALSELRGVTVFTNSLVNLQALDAASADPAVLRVHLIGGEYRRNRRDFCGFLAEDAIRKLRFGRCFLGADGYHPAVGFTTTDYLTARLNELVLENSGERVVLADRAKFEISAAVSYSRGRRVDLVVTDAPLDADAAAALAGSGTRVEVC